MATARNVGTNATQSGFSLSSLIRSQLKGDAQLKIDPDEGRREQSICATIAGREGPRVGQYCLPHQRDLNTQSATTGSGLIAHKVTIADAVRPPLLLDRLGARRLQLSGSGSLASLPSTINTSWLNEGASVAESTVTVGDCSFSPRDLAVRVEVARRLLLQAPDVEASLIGLLGDSMAAAIEAAVFSGAGGTQPLGLTQTEPIPKLIGWGAGAVPSWAQALEAIEQLLNAGAELSRLRWLFPASSFAAALAQQRSAGGNGWLLSSDATSGDRPLQLHLAGVPAFFSKNVEASRALVGDWSQLYLAAFGPPELMVNPVSRANFGATQIELFQLVGHALAQPTLFRVGVAA